MRKLFNVFLGLLILVSSLLFVNTANALDVVFSEDRPDLRTLDPRITQSRHEEMIIVQKKEKCAGGLNLEELLLYTEDLKKKSQTFMEIVSDPCLFPPLTPKRENV